MEEHQRLIIGELKHRTRNLLTIVQAVIANTLKDAKTVSEAGYVLNGRVKALSQAYSLLADAAWEGASLAKILSAQSILDTKRVYSETLCIHPHAESQFVVRELIAKRIIQIAQKGVVDRDQLCTSAAQTTILFGISALARA